MNTDCPVNVGFDSIILSLTIYQNVFLVVSQSYRHKIAGLEIGEEVTAEKLLELVLVYSACDACNVIAEMACGGINEFVKQMNNWVKSIGCTGTNFVNCDCLHDENHYTTPYDLYLILNEAVKYDLIRKIIPQSGYNTMFVGENGDSKSIAVNATDAYLTGDVDAPEGITVLGGKTGTTATRKSLTG
jgi:D-alanyl-D-alanine carboxypeptidase